MSRLLALRHGRAFERVYRRHAGDVYRYALAVLRDPDAAEQVTQTTFLNAYRCLEQTQGARPSLNLLLALAHDLCRRRTGAIRDERAFAAPEEELTEDDVRRALARLPFDERTVLVMREVESRSYQEIARILAVPVARIEALIFRARRSLREEIDGALTCHEAELAVSRDLDGRASRKERRLLRTHMRTCLECDLFVRDQHAQRIALRRLAAVGLPRALETWNPQDGQRKDSSAAASP